MSQQRLQQHAYEQAHLRALTNDIVAQLANDYLTDVDALHLAQSCVLFFLTLRHRYEYKQWCGLARLDARTSVPRLGCCRVGVITHVRVSEADVKRQSSFQFSVESTPSCRITHIEFDVVSDITWPNEHFTLQVWPRTSQHLRLPSGLVMEGELVLHVDCRLHLRHSCWAMKANAPCTASQLPSLICVCCISASLVACAPTIRPASLAVGVVSRAAALR